MTGVKSNMERERGKPGPCNWSCGSRHQLHQAIKPSTHQAKSGGASGSNGKPVSQENLVSIEEGEIAAEGDPQQKSRRSSSNLVADTAPEAYTTTWAGKSGGSGTVAGTGEVCLETSADTGRRHEESQQVGDQHKQGNIAEAVEEAIQEQQPGLGALPLETMEEQTEHNETTIRATTMEELKVQTRAEGCPQEGYLLHKL